VGDGGGQRATIHLSECQSSQSTRPEMEAFPWSILLRTWARGVGGEARGGGGRDGEEVDGAPKWQASRRHVHTNSSSVNVYVSLVRVL